MTGRILRAAILPNLHRSRRFLADGVSSLLAAGWRPHWAAFFALVLSLALIWRLPASPVEWSFIRCDSDSLFQLHRVARSLPQYPSVPAFDSFSHYPRGFRVHWLAPHTFFYASLVRLAGLGDAPLAEIGGFVSWVPPLLGTAALVLIALVARHYDRRPAVVWLSLLLAALSGEVVRPFFFGTIDHHLFAQLGVMLAALGRLERRAWLWFAGLFLLCAMTPEAVLYVSVLLLVLWVSEIAAPADDASQPLAVIWFLIPAAAGLAAFAADRVLQSQPLPLAELSWEYPTLFQPAWYLVLGASLRRLSRRSPRLRLIEEALGLVAFAALVLWGTGALAPITERLLGSSRIYVAEESSVFRRGFFAAHLWYQVLALAALFSLYRVWRARRERQGTESLFAWGLVVAANLLAFREMRHMYIFAALQLIGFSVAAFAAGDGVARLFGRERTPAIAAVVALALSLPLLLSADVTDRASERRGACAELPLVDDVAGWLSRNTPPPGDEDRRPAYGVFTTWTLGHHVHVLAQRPVVIDPFNHADPSGDWVGSLVEAMWLADSGEGFVEGLRELKVRYLVLDNPAEEIVGALRRRGDATGDVYRIEPDGRTTLLPGMSRFAAFRLFMSAGDPLESSDLVLRYASPEHEDYATRGPSGTGTISVPSLQVYELIEPGS